MIHATAASALRNAHAALDTTPRGEGGLDVLIRDRWFNAGEQGVFVDVGAARPDYLSMSALFRAAGWRIISVEPNPAFCELHRSIGSEIYQYASSNRDANDVAFYVVDGHDESYLGGEITYESYSSLGLKSEFTDGRSLDTREIRVNVRRLDSILRDNAGFVGQVDILCVDVEGWELEVIEGFSSDRYRPRVVVLENYGCQSSYRSAMRKRGYVLWRRVGQNDVYVPRDAISLSERMTTRLREKMVSALSFVISTLRA